MAIVIVFLLLEMLYLRWGASREMKRLRAMIDMRFQLSLCEWTLGRRTEEMIIDMPVDTIYYVTKYGSMFGEQYHETFRIDDTRSITLRWIAP
jgi:hypothetical protein